MNAPAVLVVGAGAIGSYVGCRLAASGAADVTVLARPGSATARAIVDHGIRIVDGPDESHAAVRVVTAAADAPAPEVVLVAVKGPETVAATAPLAELLRPDTVVLELQNGVDRAEEIDRVLGAPHTLAGAIYLECRIDEPGVVRYLSGARRIVLGEADGGPPTPRVRRVTDLLAAAGIDHLAPDDVRGELWRKFALVCAANSLTALTGGTFGDVLGLPRARVTVAGIIEEVTDVARAGGVNVPDDAVTAWTDFLEQLGPALRSSMLHDVERGRPTEVEQLNGTVVRLAEAAGVPVPRNEIITLALRARDRRAPDGGTP